MKHALLFELNSIKNYLFSSGRLRDLAGGSELLDRLTSGKNNLLDSVCEKAGIQSEVVFSRRAGGAFYAFSDSQDAIASLRNLWTLSVQQWAPGALFSVGSGSGATPADAFDNARQALQADNGGLRLSLPLAAPVTERTARSGQPAATTHAKDGAIDAATARFKRFSDLSQAGFLERYAPEEAQLSWRDWPRNLESDEQGDFPFLEDSRMIALVYADGNGLGRLLRTISEAAKESPDQYIDYYLKFSNLVSAVIKSAAQAATREVLLPARKAGELIAARPILLGGDDIVVLVRADLALSYCKAFSSAFEQSSGELLSALESNGMKNLPKRLTLGFGLVYMRASQPFHMASNLAEKLMAYAKAAAKEINEEDPPASLCFHRITGSLMDDYGDLVSNALTHVYHDERFVDTLGCYYFDTHQPLISDLEALGSLLRQDEMSRGPTRQLLTLMGHSDGAARQKYRRWRQLMQDARASQLTSFNHLLTNLCGQDLHEELPYARADSDSEWRTALHDALALVQSGSNLTEGSLMEDDVA